MEITKDIRYVGVDDHDIDLFEGQYDVSENGMAYNSYVILGEKIAVADSVDGGFVDEWLGISAALASSSAATTTSATALRSPDRLTSAFSPRTMAGNTSFRTYSTCVS